MLLGKVLLLYRAKFSNKEYCNLVTLQTGPFLRRHIKDIVMSFSVKNCVILNNFASKSSRLGSILYLVPLLE